MLTKSSQNNVSIKHEVYASLKQDLITGQFYPGEFLQEKDLARTFGVSKTPIREALSELVKDRFIQLIPRKGYFVALVDPQEVKENFELRFILECAAVELAAKRISPAELETLEGLIRRFPAAGGHLAGRRQLEAYIRANVEFHQKIAAASGNRSLAMSVTKVLEDLMRVIIIYFSLPHLEITGRDHIELINALRQGDAAEAQRVMEHHLHRTRQRLFSTFWGDDDDREFKEREPKGEIPKTA
ncbi:MAG: GntR family transcriptional regulator [Nitrospinota bacterium]